MTKGTAGGGRQRLLGESLTADLSTPLRSVEKHSQGRTADTADLSTTLRSGRDDKGEGGAINNSSC
jgi:hypothetical protein